MDDPDTLAAANLWRFIGDAVAGIVRAAPAHHIRRLPGAVMALSGEAVADLNYVAIGAGPDPAARLREFGAIIHGQRLPVLVLVSAAVAEELAPVLQELGFTHAGSMPLMTHDGQVVTLAERGITVRQVTTGADLGVANGIMARAFSLPEDALQRTFDRALLDAPGVAVFLASREDTPVSAVVTSRHGTTVGIWCMATAPEYTRQGAGSTLLVQVMAQHRASGARLFYLGATEAGYPLYERAGFRAVETISVWVVGQSTQVHG